MQTDEDTLLLLARKKGDAIQAPERGAWKRRRSDSDKESVKKGK